MAMLLMICPGASVQAFLLGSRATFIPSLSFLGMLSQYCHRHPDSLTKHTYLHHLLGWTLPDRTELLSLFPRQMSFPYKGNLDSARQSRFRHCVLKTCCDFHCHRTPWVQFQCIHSPPWFPHRSLSAFRAEHIS